METKQASIRIQLKQKLTKFKWNQYIDGNWFNGDWNKFYWIFKSDDGKHAFEIIDNCNNEKAIIVNFFDRDYLVTNKEFFTIVKRYDLDMTLTEVINFITQELNTPFIDFSLLFKNKRTLLLDYTNTIMGDTNYHKLENTELVDKYLNS